MSPDSSDSTEMPLVNGSPHFTEILRDEFEIKEQYYSGLLLAEI